MTTVDANGARYAVGTNHVESWFVRANDPTAPRAVWLKATVLTKADGTLLAESWCSVFDGDRTAAFRRDIVLGDAGFQLAEDSGMLRGELTSATGAVAWDVTFRRSPGPLGKPMSLLPSTRLVDAPFPKNKLLTPFPVADFSGGVTWDGETWDLEGWIGMQGHNWGPSHAPEYAWGQCVFPEEDAVVEGASGRLELGRRTSPLFSMLVVRRGEEEYRFDRLVDRWRQKPEIDFPSWTLEMRGHDGRARLEMTGSPSSMVCLGYDNPARPRSYCLNSKTARARVVVLPHGGTAFTLTSEHGGALEFLGADPVPEVQPVV